MQSVLRGKVMLIIHERYNRGQPSRLVVQCESSSLKGLLEIIVAFLQHLLVAPTHSHSNRRRWDILIIRQYRGHQRVFLRPARSQAEM